MNLLAFLSISIVTTSVACFSPTSSNPSVVFQQRIHNVKTSTSRYAITFEPPADDNCEIDGDCEESIWARKKKEKAEANAATMEKYQQRGIQLTEVDLMESVDQYQNSPVGGNLIAGVSLSALCEDD
jgi:hypothetical protein